MSKKLQNKHVQCLMCPKKINCEKQSESWFTLYDLMYKEHHDIPQEHYVVMDCPCFSVYNSKKELISMNEHFIKSQGEA